MGHVYVEISLRGQKGEVSLANVLVDTGATYTIIPEEILQQTGAIKLPYKGRLELGDGRRIEAEFYSTVIKLADREATIVVGTFKEAKAFVGVLTLESLGLKVNPVTGKLEPTRP